MVCKNNGDNMKTREEVQAQFESKNEAGLDVEILAYHEGQEYPIIAQAKYGVGWMPSAHKEDGAAYGSVYGTPLIKKRTVLPKDILCEVWDESSIHVKRFSDGEGEFFEHGANSCSTVGEPMPWKHHRVIENPLQPWLGGKCPIPEGCEYRVMVGGEWCYSNRILGINWEASSKEGCVTAYQILGEKESK